MTTAPEIFADCVAAINRGVFMVRESSMDKEFHFQNWFKKRLEESGLNFEQGDRNSYPDFRLVKETEGVERASLSGSVRRAGKEDDRQTN